MRGPEQRGSTPEWKILALAIAGFLLFLYAGEHSGAGIFARLLGP